MSVSSGSNSQLRCSSNVSHRNKCDCDDIWCLHWRHRTRCVTGGNCRAAVASRCYYHQSRGRRRTECRRLGDGRGRSQRGIPPPRTAQPAGLSTPMCTQDLIVNSAIINYASFSQLTYSQYNGKSISRALFVTL